MSQRVAKSEQHNHQDGLRKATVQNVVDSERHLVIVTFGRRLTLQDIQQYTQRLLANPSFEASFSEIVDLTQVEEVDLQASEFLKLADKVDPFSEKAKRAFVVRNSVQNHAARMHKVLGTGRRIEIFRSMEEAEQWIRTAE